MADSNNGSNHRTNRDKDDGSVFSWSNEFEAYTKRSNQNGDSTNEQNTYGADRSSGYNPRPSQTRRPPAPRNNNYRYEYPGEDYKYKPRSVYSDYQRQADYFSAEYGSGERRAKTAQNQPNRDGSQTAKTSQRPGKKNGTKKAGTNAESSKHSKNKKPKNKPGSKTGERSKEKSAPKKPKPPIEKDKSKAQAKQKHKEELKLKKKKAKEKIKLEKANKRIKKLKAQGLSSDEIRALLQQEQKRKHLLRSLLVVFSVIVAIAVGLGVFAAVKGLPIAKIEINGSKEYKDSEIIASAEIDVGDNMITISESALNEKLTTSLPYIESVKIKRELPDTLKITVTETKEKLLLETEKGFICIDKNGKIVSTKKQAAKGGKIKVVGFASQEYEVGRKFEPDREAGNSQKYEILNSILTALEETKIKGCNFIDLTEPNLIELGFSDQMKIYVDADTDYVYSFNLLNAQIKNGEFKSNGPYYYDLRFKGQIVHKEGELT